jgi:hypothetical protein
MLTLESLQEWDHAGGFVFFEDSSKKQPKLSLRS